MRLIWLTLALPMMALCQPVLEATVPRSLVSDIAAWATGIGIWATLGYTIYDQNGSRIARFILRTRSPEGREPSESDLESGISRGRQLLNLGMQTISIASSDRSIGENQLSALERAAGGLVELPPITEDESDFFLQEFRLRD